MAAPTPRPAKLKLLNGVRPGRDSGGRLVASPPRFERSAPEPPDWFDDEARAEWARVVPALDELGVLKEPDRALLSAFCTTWSTYMTAIRQVQVEGITLINQQTQCPRKNPAVGVAETAAAQLRTLGNELGLSPAAERLLSVSPRDEDDVNPF